MWNADASEFTARLQSYGRWSLSRRGEERL
jgi:hypothetical protein